jgi:hypothetical protein
MAQHGARKSYVLCVRNDGRRASLVVRRLYQCLPDPEGARRGLLRVVDESGEDCLDPAEFFVPIEVPVAAEKAFARTR